MPWRVEFSERRKRLPLQPGHQGKQVAGGLVVVRQPPGGPPQCRAMAACRRRHNLWKRALIDAHVARGSLVLDLACGKGGDLSKFAHRHPRRLVGYDVSTLSLAEARRRASLLPSLPVELVVVDLTSRRWPACARRFDAATCFFALHYLCGSAAAVRQWGAQLRERLRPGAPSWRSCRTWTGCGIRCHPSWASRVYPRVISPSATPTISASATGSRAKPPSTWCPCRPRGAARAVVRAGVGHQARGGRPGNQFYSAVVWRAVGD